MKFGTLIITAVALLALTALLVFAVNRSSDEDDQLYNQFVTIRGTVKIIETPGQKTYVPVGIGLIFQRTDCKRCLAVAITDENGKYTLRVGKGKYRLVVRNCGLVNQSLDCLAPDQPRILDANNVVLDNIFNVNLVRPATPLDITLPPATKPPSDQK